MVLEKTRWTLQGSSVRFLDDTLKFSKQKEDPETNLDSAFFYIKTSLQYFYSNVSI